MIRRLLLICAAIAGIAVACGIPDSGNVSRIPDDKVGALDDTLPTTSTTTTTIPATTLEPTTTTTPIATTTTIATEDVTLYFINSGGILVPYTRPLLKGASSGQVLSALQEGPPPGDIGVGLRTAIPRETAAKLRVSEDGSGVATVDLPINFYDEVVEPEDQILAFGQIVLTLTEVGRVGQVMFTMGGNPTGVLRGAGDLSQPGQPLPPRDYFPLLEAPVPTTTTTTTIVTTPATV
jgi:spore germination protein GerM